MIIALAGRLIDAPHVATPRFPATNLEAVKTQITEFLQTHDVTHLVCAAACGADILALEAAHALGIRRRIILPFDRALFRAMSVASRGGDWGERYDELLAEVISKNDLIEGHLDPNDSQTWYSGNLDILNEAQKLAAQTKRELAALVIWNGEPRGPEDVTGHFKAQAEARGLNVVEILTL